MDLKGGGQSWWGRVVDSLGGSRRRWGSEGFRVTPSVGLSMCCEAVWPDAKGVG